jgi:predicted  nucleic acid-binding Zn-ribbon protein
LGIRFEPSSDTLVLYRPDGKPFADYTEVQQKLETAKNRASEAENRAAEAENRASEAENRANLAVEQLEQERQRAKQLEELLRKAGLDPNIADRS